MTPRTKLLGVDVRLDGDRWLVNPIWTNVDRPSTGGWIVDHYELASRLATAIMAGVVLTEPQVKTDVNGRTYVQTRDNLPARDLNTALTELGYPEAS